ncbi:MAG: methyl-accepting chemotaxis protein [Treponema sp.]|nr:methyl-accepting chemotaxis protein [Treponema sp.]
MKKRYKSLSVQILSLCIGLVVLAVVTVSIIFMLNLERLTKQQLEAQAHVTMQYLDADLLKVLASYTDLVHIAASVINHIVTNTDRNTADAAMIDMAATVPDVISLYYGSAVSRFAPGGLYLDSDGWNPPSTWDPPNRLWHQAAMANPDTVMIIDPYVDADTNELVITVSTTARNINGNISGVMAADVLLTQFAEIVLAGKITHDGSTVLIDTDGLFIVHPDISFMVERNLFEEMPHLDRNTILNDQINVVFYDNNYICSAPVHNTSWILVSMGSLEELQAPFWYILLLIIITGIGIVFISFLTALIFSRTLTRPIIRLFGVLEAIAAGDFTRKIEAKGSDEISQMTLLLGETQDSIKKLIINIKKEAETLSNIGNDLASNMSLTAAAVTEITSNIKNINDRIMNQNASVSATHETMEQFVFNINSLNDHVENQSNNISLASSAIEQMLANINSVTATLVNNTENVKNLSDTSEIGRSGLSGVAADIREIVRESEGLLEINSVMQNIASQTNLLSMNAAIEAAHAGEAGKGFAVVAEEIRKLAENSSNQSKTIGAVLKKIKTSIDSITSSTDNVLGKFEAIDSSVRTVYEQEENIRSAMEEQGLGSKQILEGIGSVNESTRHVKNGSREMLEGAKEVIRESESLDKATKEIVSGMNEMAAGAEHIDAAVNHVNEISGKNREAINALMQEVSRFKVD